MKNGSRYPEAGRFKWRHGLIYAVVLTLIAMMLVPHDPAWKAEFEALRDVYAELCGETLVAIEHVGSTAIAGIVAKPILDIDVVIPGYTVFDEIKRKLESVGYRHNGDQGLPTREVFKRVDERVPHYEGRSVWMCHKLYVCPADSPELARHIAFRDYLRKSHGARREYEAIKLDIAARSNGDRKIYARLKEREGRCRAFVSSVLEKYHK